MQKEDTAELRSKSRGNPNDNKETPSQPQPPVEAPEATPEVHHIWQSGSCTTEEARPAMLRILQSALTAVTSWHSDPGFYACYGWGKDDDKVPDLLARLIADISALFEPHTVHTNDAGTEEILQDLHITEDADGDRDYNDQITWGPRARGVLPGPYCEEASFTSETPQPYTLNLTRRRERGNVTHTTIELNIDEVEPDAEVTHG